MFVARFVVCTNHWCGVENKQYESVLSNVINAQVHYCNTARVVNALQK